MIIIWFLAYYKYCKYAYVNDLEQIYKYIYTIRPSKHQTLT